MQYDRRNTILQALAKDGSVRVSELMKEFGVSIETIRRDLEYLESRGFLTRVYGGAVPVHPRALEPAYADREIIHFKEKKAIARCAVDLIEDGDVIGIDVGTTALEFAKALVGKKKKLTAITNSLKIAMVLSEDAAITVITTGGQVRGGEISASGFLAEQNAGQFQTDKYVMGIGGLSEAYGITDYHVAEANLRRLFISRTKKVIGLMDHSKAGAVAMNRICGIEDLDTIVLDEGTDQEAVRLLQKNGVTVVVAR